MPKLRFTLFVHTPVDKYKALSTARPRQYQYAIREHRLQHIAPEQLDGIIRQVQAEGFHVEYISSFGLSGDATEIISAINRWTKLVDLKVSINYERGICFFEQL